MLVIIDEYSRFPFVYACKNLKASTLIEKLTDLFVCLVCQAIYILTMGPILCFTNLNRGCTAWALLLAGLPGIILEAMDKSNVITVLFEKPSFWLYVLKNYRLRTGSTFYLMCYILFVHYYALLQIVLLMNVCFSMIENHLMVYRCHLG